tara:strand:- start:5347 stop:6333 length:987 start_codon:yes stop_codon:yes gene_type:complete
MEFAADVVDGVHIASLGSPAALDADGIWDGVSATNSATSYSSSDYKSTFDGSSTSLTTTAGMIDATYGRVLTAVGSAGSNHVCTITGRDYLGQIVKENLTLSGTNPIYGKKAFKYVDKLDIAAGAASDTCDIGWSDVLGLPYAAKQLLGWTEDGVHKGVRRDVADTTYVVHATDASLFTASPAQGFVTGVSMVSAIANSSATSAITLEIGTTAVAGLSLTISASDSLGDLYSDFTGTDDHGLTSKIAKGGAVELVSDTGGTNGAGYVSVHVDENVRFIDADTTATQTATTSDPRGTVLAYTSCNGSVTYEVRYAVNTSNLHGVAQYSG